MKAKIGKMYRHYKGDKYLIVALALDEETLKKKVVYQAQYDSAEFGNKAVWIRDKQMFEEKITVAGESVERFDLHPQNETPT